MSEKVGRIVLSQSTHPSPHHARFSVPAPPTEAGDTGQVAVARTETNLRMGLTCAQKTKYSKFKENALYSDRSHKSHRHSLARSSAERVSSYTSCAAALDRVYRYPALVAELSKVLSISETDAVVAVRQRYRSIEGMHEFMRLAGVVKARVTCQPGDDGRPQLDALDEHCWAHVRHYLQLDDVAWPCRSSMNVP
ncbi:hypothetical protein HPB51_018831 [Rhipicephalus microplus]|uniref:Uncharacterized protein n=1 Tax=Rhipicephalus microplus TaxID=6941 RepID=A0A9J6DPP8_RHIMP|nr:hypothetical protein HPB51_018831 [Rhipicephalus microplus]